MTTSQPTIDEATENQTSQSPAKSSSRQYRWSAIAPPVAWWWVVIAGAAALFLGFGMLRAVQLFARPLGVLILSIAISASLAPLITKLERITPRMLAAVIVYILLLLSLVGIGWLVVPRFTQQLQSFMDDAPELLNRAQEIYNRLSNDGGASITEVISSFVQSGGLNIISLPFTVFESLLQVLLILFISFYSLLVAPKVQEFILSLLPDHRHAKTRHLLGNIIGAMGGYVRGVALTATFVGIFAYAGLYFLGVDYALLLAITAGVLEIIPILGTVVSTILIVVVAFFQSPQLALFALIYMLILQQIEGNMLFPTIMSSQTHMSPLLSLFAFFAGGVVGGLLGAVVAIPLSAALRVLVQETVAPAIRRWSGASHTDDANAVRDS